MKKALIMIGAVWGLSGCASLPGFPSLPSLPSFEFPSISLPTFSMSSLNAFGPEGFFKFVEASDETSEEISEIAPSVAEVEPIDEIPTLDAAAVLHLAKKNIERAEAEVFRKHKESRESRLKSIDLQTTKSYQIDKRGVMRMIVASLQDLSFIVSQSNYTNGSVMATRTGEVEILMSVVTYPQAFGDEPVFAVNISANVGTIAVTDSQLYYDFFLQMDQYNALGKAGF